MKPIFISQQKQKGNNSVITSQRKQLAFWQNISKKLKSALFQKYYKLLALYQTSRYIFQTEGVANLCKQSLFFLQGKRLNSKLPVNNVQKLKINAPIKKDYKKWLKANELTDGEINLQHLAEVDFQYRPVINILTLIKTSDRILLERMLNSVLNQTYSRWEIYLICDTSEQVQIIKKLTAYSLFESRIKLKSFNKNLRDFDKINAVLSSIEGDFVTFLGDEDILSHNALYENVKLLNQNPNADVIYSDEDVLNSQGIRCNPHFKPDWSPDLFYSMMYISHLGLYRYTLIEKVGGCREGVDGAEEYDLVLHIIEHTDQIYHIPKVLYHQAFRSYNLNTKDHFRKSRAKAVADYFERQRIAVEVTNGSAENLLRVKRILKKQPLVSIIIPTRDKVHYLKRCIESIIRKTVYQNYEIIVVDNRSSESVTTDYLGNISKNEKISVLTYDKPFNFSAINNFAVEHATGEILLFLNNDTEIISKEWLDSMVEHAMRSEVGVVGARLLYPNGQIQHAGVITGIGSIAGHSHKYLSGDHPGYFGRAKAVQNLSAVTGACMMVRKDIFTSLGGFNEKNLAVAFNDIDFCLRVRQKNLLIVYTPYAEIYHLESISRGSDRKRENVSRYQREVDYMLDSWGDTLRYDPYYNPNLTLKNEDFSISTD